MSSRATSVFEPEPEIRGHPATPLWGEHGQQLQMITLCAHCGEMRTVIFLRKDRWFCFRCLAEGATPPNMYPVA